MFTGLRTALRALRIASEAQDTAHNLELQLKSLRADLEHLEGQHLSLRGRFYASRPGAPDAADSGAGGSREARKAAALAKFGLVTKEVK